MKSLYEWCIENNRKDILQSWDSDRNKGITPSNVSYGSNKKYYWLCEIGHSWLMAPKDRRKKGCPYCKGHQLLVGFNDLKTKNPELASEWNYEKNGDLTPDQVTIGYDKKVWWKCHICGHEWEATICNRTGSLKRGCPNCGKEKNIENLRKAVIQYTMDDEFVAEFKSAMDAERQTGIHQIHRVCRNERKSAGGYKWKYK